MRSLFPDPDRCEAHGRLHPCLLCLKERVGEGHRDGETYDPERDKVRLGEQAQRVFDVMADGKWRSLSEIALAATSDGIKVPEASASARLRDFRKPKFGGHEVERRNEGGGLWRYRLVLAKTEASQ